MPCVSPTNLAAFLSCQTTDVATGPGGSMVYISGYKLGTPSSDGSQNVEALLMAYNSSGVQQWVAEYG